MGDKCDEMRINRRLQSGTFLLHTKEVPDRSGVQTNLSFSVVYRSGACLYVQATLLAAVRTLVRTSNSQAHWVC
jgi:hypothetical protein